LSVRHGAIAERANKPMCSAAGGMRGIRRN
jgi:hypothetical protein